MRRERAAVRYEENAAGKGNLVFEDARFNLRSGASCAFMREGVRWEGVVTQRILKVRGRQVQYGIFAAPAGAGEGARKPFFLSASELLPSEPPVTPGV